MAALVGRLVRDKGAVVEAVAALLRSVPGEHDYQRDIRRAEGELSAIRAKKDRLLEMSVEGALSTAEFKQRNDGFNQQLRELSRQLDRLRTEEAQSRAAGGRLDEIGAALEELLSFRNGIDSALVTTILDHIVVKEGSTREEVHLDIYLKPGGLCGAVLDRGSASFRFTPPKNTTPNQAARTTSSPSAPSA